MNANELEAVLLARQGRWYGRELTFRCPSGLHEDRHPSAGYNPEKKVWHCFVCGAGGGMKDLMMRLGLTTEKGTPTRDGLYSPIRQGLPRFVFDWRMHSHELMLFSEDRFLHGHAVLTQAKGLDISGWTPEEINIASNAVCDAIQDIDESERVADLVFNLRAYGLEEESERKRESRCCKA